MHVTSFDTPIARAVRRIRAVGPSPDLQTLRASYLDLLKLSLCDLAGASTREVTSDREKRVFSRELTGEDQLAWRAEGRDWPLDGMTMVGLLRLDDLQACVDTVVGDGIQGDLIEAGAWRGGASILMRATLDSLGAHDRTVWVADSFQGFPRPDEQDARADRDLESHMDEIDFPFSTLQTVQGYFARFGCERGVRFVPGFFEDTLDGLRGRRWSLVRLDADTYKATRLALEALYPGLAIGGYLILDDYFHPLLPESCRKAVDEFRRDHAITEPIEQIDWTGARWRRECAPGAESDEHAPADPVAEGRADAPAPGSRLASAQRSPASASQSAAPRIPTDREVQLADELAALRARVRGLEAELEGSRRSPRGVRAGWARRKRKTV